MDELISRLAVIQIIEKMRARIGHNLERSVGRAMIEILDEVGENVEKLPPVFGTNLAEVGTDLISRTQAIEVVQKRHFTLSKEKVLLINDLEKLPSAQPTFDARDTQYNLPIGTDLISRQAAIDAAIEAADDWDGGCNIGRQKRIEKYIGRLPSAEPHWIPVTERLPETTDAVLTTYIVNGDRSRRYVEESSYYGSDESWSSPWDEYRIAGTRIEVIAWMPLPESYRGE